MKIFYKTKARRAITSIIVTILMSIIVTATFTNKNSYTPALVGIILYLVMAKVAHNKGMK